MNVDAINTDDSIALHAPRMAVRASGAVTDRAENLADSIPADNQRLIGVWNGPTAIRHIYPYALFNKSPLQLRRIGALGGKACARNQRTRRALVTTPSAPIPLRAAPRQTTAQAMAVLDARFPWLQRAEHRRRLNTSSRSLQPRSHHCANQDSKTTK
jgi:hypothetical protein